MVKRGLYLAFTIVVTLSIFAYLFSVVSVADILHAVKNISPYYLALFFVFSMIMSIGRTWRYLLFLSVSGYRPSRSAMFLVTLARNFFSDLLPARLGTLIYIYLTQSRLGVPFDAAASSFALSFIFDIIVLGIMVIGASLFVSSALLSPVMLISASAVALLICVLVLLLLPRGLRWMGEGIAGLSWLPEKLREKCRTSLAATGIEVDHIRTQAIYTRAIALSLVVRLGKYLSLYALLLAIVVPLGHTVPEFPFSKVFMGLCAAELSASLPISGIAGFGAYEGAWALVFQMLGYGAELSALTSVAHHLISQVYGYLLGAAALLALLLPMFKSTTAGPEPQAAAKGSGWFWLRYTALLVCIGAVFFMVLSSADASRAADKSKGLGSGALPQHSELPEGRVVFTKTDGIYTKRLGEDVETRVLPEGSFPRWSPDGRKIAFVRSHTIAMLDIADGTTTDLAEAANPRAVVFNDTGDSVFYTDGKSVFAVDIRTRQSQEVIKGKVYLELDVADGGGLVAVTAKEKFGYNVYVVDVSRDLSKKISRGCSASLSPGGDRVTVNGRKHLKLNIFDHKTGERTGAISAPAGYKFDDQFWSNHPDWIVSLSEGNGANIYVHQVSTNRSWQVTHSGDNNRADLYIGK